MSENKLEQTIEAIGDLHGAVMEAVRARQNELTKPKGSLGVLETLSAQMAGITGFMQPILSPRSVIICAGDHGVVAEGVSAYPPDVTYQMVHNFLAGGAAINVMARQIDARVIVLDVGVASDLPHHLQLRSKKVRYGTANMVLQPAMTPAEAVAAIEAGITTAEAEINAGARLLVTGDMGIGNTTASAAIAAVLTDLPVGEVTGPGTGLGLAGWRRKCQVIQQALDKHRPAANAPLDILSKVGGLEIAAIVGVILTAAAERIPVIIDGFVSTAGAALAAELCPEAKQFMIAGHRSPEPGHQALLRMLELEPVLDLGMRLGEGTGAILAIPLLEAAVATLNEMATFEEAHVAQKLEDEPQANTHANSHDHT